jgi:hypothetical protein
VGFTFSFTRRRQLYEWPVEEGCSVARGEGDADGTAATTCALTAADADAVPPVAGACAVATGSGTCDYVAPEAEGKTIFALTAVCQAFVDALCP